MTGADRSESLDDGFIPAVPLDDDGDDIPDDAAAGVEDEVPEGVDGLDPAAGAGVGEPNGEGVSVADADRDEDFPTSLSDHDAIGTEAEITDADPVDAGNTDDTGYDGPGRGSFDDPFAALDVDGGDETDFDDAFERIEVGELTDEEVWDVLGDVDTDPDTGGGSAADDARAEHVIHKRLYCQRCEYFSDPPETACTHEDGTILEVVETDEFRVRGCPMVGEDGPLFERSR